MTKRATFTMSELARAIKAAEQVGKVAIQTRDGIAFVDPAHIGQPIPMQTTEGNSCDGKFGAARSR